VLAFGDNYNDIDMLSAVGIGVAVENAISEAKDVADHRTACNIDDGVAMFLEGFNV
jgi:hydroxymethylpyrimidine pyrophosphatase-like HAD family hydrolase